MNSNESQMKLRGEQKVLKEITTKSGNLKDVASTQIGQQMLFEDAIAIVPTVISWIQKDCARVYRTILKNYFVDEEFILQKVTETLLHLAGAIHYDKSASGGELGDHRHKKISKNRHKKVSSLNRNIMPELDFAMTWRFLEIVVESSQYFHTITEKELGKNRASVMCSYQSSISWEILGEISRKSERAFYPMPATQKPLPWSLDEEGKAVGGYEGHQFNLVRADDKFVDFSKFGDKIFDAINYIQSTPWKVNIPLLNIVRDDLKVPVKEDYIKME